MKKLETAFTLGEVLVTIAIVGIIASMLMPTINRMQPDKQKMLFKKAYVNVERIVSELVNDDYLYPEATGYNGLDNVAAVTLNNTAYSGATKFCQLFAMKMNTIDGNANCNGNTVVSFKTNDGIAYYMPNSNFATESEIMIDINGDAAPNCDSKTASCRVPDRYFIYVAPDGGVRVTGDKEKAFLRSTTVARD